MKYSVIVPVFNAEKTILSSLRSVHNQTFGDFEVIIVDDGSTDSSGIICREFMSRDPRFRYIKQENQGVSIARNNGIQKACGDYITFLDSDDEYEPYYLEAFDRLMEQVPSCNHYWCGFKIRSDIESRDGEIHVFSAEGEVTLHDRKDIMTLHEQWMDSTLWNKVFNRKIIVENSLRMDESLSLGEDLLFNYQYLEVAGEKIAILNVPNYIYRQSNNDTLDSKYRKNLKELYEQLDTEVMKWITKWGVSERGQSKYYSSVFFMQEKVLRNTFRLENQDGLFAKYRYNREILKSAKFQEALKKAECFIHPLYMMAYKSHSYLLVQLIDLLVKVKRRK